MSLQCLAVIGKVSEPLYLKDVKPPNETGDENDAEDVFGFTAAHQQERLSLRKEVSESVISYTSVGRILKVLTPVM
jgi:hypothetical protein